MPDLHMDQRPAYTTRQWGCKARSRQACALLGQGLIQTTDAAGAGSHSHQRLSHFPHFMGAGTRHEHVHQSALATCGASRR
jgi:hypothetical protein